MGFGSTFGKSWSDYKANFKEIFKFVIVFYGIPFLILTLVEVVFFLKNDEVRNFINLSLSGSQGASFFSLPLVYILASIIGGLYFLVLYVFFGASLTSICVKKNKFTFKELTSSGKSWFFSYLGFGLTVAVFLIGLLLLLIIPGIVFSVYWTFAVYVFFDEKKGILVSLRKSREIVRGRWWKTLGYSLLAMLIIYGMAFIAIFIISLMTSSGYFLSILNKAASALIYHLFAIPLLIFFLKNFYFQMKKDKKDEKKKK